MIGALSGPELCLTVIGSNLDRLNASLRRLDEVGCTRSNVRRNEQDDWNALKTFIISLRFTSRDMSTWLLRRSLGSSHWSQGSVFLI